jgi:hypothetical protein
LRVCYFLATYFAVVAALTNLALSASHPALRIMGLGSNIGHGLFVGWVEHPDIFCWVSFLDPTYVSAIFFAVSGTQQNGHR